MYAAREMHIVASDAKSRRSRSKSIYGVHMHGQHAVIQRVSVHNGQACRDKHIVVQMMLVYELETDDG